MSLKTSDFDYDLPADRIAQVPVEPRDRARLLVVHRSSGEFEHRTFRDLATYVHPGDILVANDSRVLPARLLGRKTSGGRVELLLLREMADQRWEALVRGKHVRPGTRLLLAGGALQATIVGETADGARLVEFDRPLLPELDRLGQVPLPPYIHEPLADSARYQTVYARVRGSVAAPTAGLHFTEALIAHLEAQGVAFAFATLHIGLDTFRPLQVETVSEHRMHREWAELSADTADRINARRRAGGRCVAVGTTSVRVLETAARRAGNPGQVAPFRDWTDLFLTPGVPFEAVDALVTNFHLPRSTLLMLVSAFAGKELIDAAYREAIRTGYRFYSFGDAMLIL